MSVGDVLPTSDANAYRRQWWVINRLHYRWSAWVVLLASLLLTLVAYLVANDLAVSQAQQRFEYRADEIVDAIKERLRIYEQTLVSSVALIYASDKVERDEWRRFVTSLELEKHWPGIQGLGYAVPVSAEEREAHIEAIRAEGFPEFTIKPEGIRDAYTSIIFLEPFDWRNQRAFGYDMWSHDMRREAMARARDLGETATSGVITLVQETDKDVQKGFLTYVPVYRNKQVPQTLAERRDQFVGWVYAAFRAGDLLRGILGDEDPSIEFEIYDGSKPAVENLLFDTNDKLYSDRLSPGSGFALTINLNLQGRPWTIQLNTPEGFNTNSINKTPRFILVGGIIIDLLLFYIIISLHRLNRKAHSIAESLTLEYKEAKEREARANKAKSDFLANMSHELRTPLNSIIGFSHKLIQRCSNALDEREQDALITINRNGQNLLRLINDILDLSKVEAGRMELTASEFDLWATIKPDLAQWADQAKEKSLKFLAGEPSQVVTLYSDPIKVQQIVNNLISNSIKYTSKGEVSFNIFLTAKSKKVTLTVKDSGIGMSPQDMNQLFNNYYRAQQVRQQAIQGTGLGLVICWQLVNLLGGNINVDSELGRGTTFTVELPLSVAHAVNGKHLNELPAPPWAPPSTTGPSASA